MLYPSSVVLLSKIGAYVASYAADVTHIIIELCPIIMCVTSVFDSSEYNNISV